MHVFQCSDSLASWWWEVITAVFGHLFCLLDVHKNRKWWNHLRLLHLSAEEPSTSSMHGRNPDKLDVWWLCYRVTDSWGCIFTHSMQLRKAPVFSPHKQIKSIHHSFWSELFEFVISHKSVQVWEGHSMQFCSRLSQVKDLHLKSLELLLQD